MKKILSIFTSLLVLSFTPTAFAETAIFAGGCFWYMESPFDAIRGVSKTISGYTGGTKLNPTYEDVSGGSTGHLEALEVTYDPKIVSYSKLLKVYWRNVDPYDRYGQFCDKGEQYVSAVYVGNAEERLEFEKSKPKGEVVTLLLDKKVFYAAEEYHQDYYKKNPIRYKFYRFNCGRDKRLKEIWGTNAH